MVTAKQFTLFLKELPQLCGHLANNVHDRLRILIYSLYFMPKGPSWPTSSSFFYFYFFIFLHFQAFSNC